MAFLMSSKHVLFALGVDPTAGTLRVSQATPFLASCVTSIRPCICTQVASFRGSTCWHNFPFVPDANTSKPSKSEKQTLVANSTAFASCLVSLMILDLCSEGMHT